MESFTFHFPTQEEQERERSFRTFMNYCRAWVHLLNSDMGEAPTAPLPAVAGPARFNRLRARQPALDRCRRSLTIAWSTEMLIRLQVNFLGTGELIRYANAWVPIQAYYAVYNAIVAFNSIASNVPNNHRSQINAVNDLLQQSSWLPDCFRRACTACPQHGPASFRLLEDGTDRTFSNLTLGLDDEVALSLVAKSLKTTRDTQHAEKRQEFLRREGRTRLRPGEHDRLDGQIHPITIFDFLLRLRVRCNYWDAESLIHGAMNVHDAGELSRSLSDLTWHLLAFLETLIAGRLGIPVLQGMVSAFGGIRDTPVRPPVLDRWQENPSVDNT